MKKSNTRNPPRKTNPEDRTSRWFEIVAYAESETVLFEDIIEALNISRKTYCYILHDKDIITEGENKGQPKKPHYHIMVNWESSTRRSSVANTLCILKEFVTPATPAALAMYLTHSTYKAMKEGKHRYDESAIVDPHGICRDLLHADEAAVDERVTKWDTLADAVGEWVASDEYPAGAISLMRFLASRIDPEQYNSCQMRYVYDEAIRRKEHALQEQAYQSFRGTKYNPYDPDERIKRLGEAYDRIGREIKKIMEE